MHSIRRLFLISVILLLSAFTAQAQVKILAVGDSLTAGYGLPVEDGFTVQLEQELERRGYDADVINAGISGDTTRGGLSRLAWSLADNPDVVILELGANDMLRGLPVERARENLSAMLQILADKDAAVLFSGMLSNPAMGAEYQAAFNAMYPALGQEFARENFRFDPFFLAGLTFSPVHFQADGLHPNSAGVKIIAARIATQLEPLIGSPGK